jgi:DNA-directed RNA polymerase alpha subunit
MAIGNFFSIFPMVFLTSLLETVYIADNTSIMQDDVLAHRLGLLPLNADPREFQFKPSAFTLLRISS